MALQGDLDSFSLPDVLRLLAGTAKSGRLGLTGSAGSGEVWMLEGEVVGGSVTTRPNAKEGAEVIYELLEMNGGSFLFDDSEQLVGDGERTSVEAALERAEQLRSEWAEVTTVVPSLEHWVAIAAELDGEEVTVNAEDWRLLSAVAAGATVRAVAEHLDASDLAASQRVRGMVEAGLVTIGESPDGAVSAVGADVEEPEVAGSSSYDHFDPKDLFADADVVEAETFADERDLVTLSAEEGPVVLETSEDALLPEPLPGEGTAYSAEPDDHAPVDARTFDDPSLASPAPSEPADFSESTYDALLGQPVETAETAETAEPVETVFGDTAEGPKSAFATGWEAEGDESQIGSSEEAFKAVGWDDNPPVDHLGEDDEAKDGKPEEGDSDRSSLLKFLSSVKP